MPQNQLSLLTFSICLKQTNSWYEQLKQMEIWKAGSNSVLHAASQALSVLRSLTVSQVKSRWISRLSSGRGWWKSSPAWNQNSPWSVPIYPCQAASQFCKYQRNTDNGSGTPIANETWTMERLASPDATMLFAACLAMQAPLRSALVGSLPENVSPPQAPQPP